ncbi:TetR/AcrR family transcriptional regulator [Macrococcus equipercicus]|uniref:TetR family transcriptional regulator n=1 Tax=Macrococcus equipercicus TaxID=69967 RepID=A0A9Q9BNG2_9STAP|nr:TetR/AcrR family transcriptional regulator [Macrococcus equipercicus]UTH12796.1 TetR family transcriptional regulator [Macrococcus equipercicus]
MHEDLQSRLIQSALILFEENGFKNTTVNSIVIHSGSSKGGFYHHFKSKDELLYRIHESFINHVNRLVDELEQKDLPPAEKLDYILTHFIFVYDHYKAHITVFNDENKYLADEYKTEIVASRRKFKSAIETIIIEGQAADVFTKDIHPTVITMSILGMVNWMYTWYKPDGRKSLEDIAEEMKIFVFNALRSHS